MSSIITPRQHFAECSLANSTRSPTISRTLPRSYAALQARVDQIVSLLHLFSPKALIVTASPDELARSRFDRRIQDAWVDSVIVTIDKLSQRPVDCIPSFRCSSFRTR